MSSLISITLASVINETRKIRLNARTGFPLSFQRRGVIGVLIAQSDGKDMLPQKGADIMERSLRTALVMKGGCGRLCDTKVLIDFRKQMAGAAGGHAATVKTNDNLFQKGFYLSCLWPTAFIRTCVVLIYLIVITIT